jgi:translation initiation factor IF-2
MSKVRINELAKELEIKSKTLIDALTAMGFDEKKTHSSSLTDEETRRVRSHFGGSTPVKPSTASRQASAAIEPKPKIDLSKISKPGDVMRAILEKKEAEAAAAAAPYQRPVVAAPPAKVAPVVVAPAAKAKPAAAPIAPVAPAAPKAEPPAEVTAPAANAPAGPRRIVPQPRQAPNIIPNPPAIAARPPAGPVVAKPPAGAERPAIASTQPLSSAPVVVKPSAVPNAPAAASVPSPPAPVAAPPAAPEIAAAVEAPVPEKRRVIMPMTGPRPVYKSTVPPQAARPPQGAGPGVQRGQPIFTRPRPQFPGQGYTPGQGGTPGGPGNYQGGGGGYQGNRPSSGPPGARRPMHPTSGPGGPRPGGFGARPGMPGRPGFGGPRPGGPGAAPGMLPVPGADAARPARSPGGHARRGGGPRYEKSKEGPMKGFQPPPRFGMGQTNGEPLPITRTITITDGISVKDLAEKLGVRGKDLIAMLLGRGIFVTVNQSLDTDLVKDLSRQLGADVEAITFEDQMANEALEDLLGQENLGDLEVTRSPVVTVMGHVDHGKTSLLDAIRSTEVAAGEAGGITQHIGAYKVKITKEGSPAFGREIVFLDTPGHEAFTRMRARGAKVTDIVVVVVAADDGVMPQTLEAIDHAQAAKVPMIIAVNKIDKPDANPDKVKQQLGDRGLVPEAWGGNTVFVDVSAKKRMNLDLLEEMICLVADLGNLKATPDRPAVGTVLEAKLDRGRGAVGSILVQNGTLKVGDSFIVGNTFGKIRAMFDDRGREVKEAGPSTPVEILGLEGMPDAGDTFLVLADRDKAKGIAQYRKAKERESQLSKSSRVSLEGLAEQIKHAGRKDLAIILKGDVQGSVQVLADSLQKMSTDKVQIKVIHTGVGAITESDILLASASNAIVIGFGVRPERKAADLAEQEGVEIRMHSIIYELQDEIRKAMLGLLDPVIKETRQGSAEVLEIFRIPKVGTIGGCRVLDGYVRRDSELRVMRDGVEVYKGKLSSLKRFKDEASEVRAGQECGIGFQNFNDIKVGDTLESFSSEKVAAELGELTAK